MALDETAAAVDLYWLPLGAGGRSVRLNGRVYEAVAARAAGRPPRDLYHSALEVRCERGRFVIEMTPVVDARGARRGVVGEGAACARARAGMAGRGGGRASRGHRAILNLARRRVLRSSSRAGMPRGD